MPIRGFDPHYYYYIGDYLIKKLDLRQDINEDEFVSKTAYNTQMRDQMGFLIYKSNGSEGIGHHGFELKEQDKKNS